MSACDGCGRRADHPDDWWRVTEGANRGLNSYELCSLACVHAFFVKVERDMNPLVVT